MKCSRCGRRKCLFETYADMDKDINLCIDCLNMFVSTQNYHEDHKMKEYGKMKEKLISNEKCTKEFLKWVEDNL